MKKIIILFSMLSIFLVSCDHHDKKNRASEKVVVAKLQKPSEVLYYSGVLQPINTFPVISPVDGNIVSMNFSYGEPVNQGRQLLVIDSKILSENYRKSVSDYLQKKQSYLTQVSSFKGEKKLYDAGVVSRNEYLMQKTTFNDAALNYFQSQYALKKILHTAGVDFESIESLSLSDTATVEKILEKHFHHLLIYAPHSGIVLFPPKSDNNSQQQQSISGKLVPGSEIKEGDLLLSIGDLSGLRATFDVSEMDIVRIHTGMNVVVTSSAFPAVILNGVVTDVSAQAKEDDTHSGISEFTVGISIPQVSKKDMESIRVGMTAKFKIALQHSAHILLPIQAVSENNGKTWVTVVQSHQLKKVEVKTGYTTPTQIEILSGIKPGDKIQIDDRS
ncbi:MAG: hypothetical protein A3I77_00865 [Gammaproteobacteria bacterium RIFCSPLOWO2_02_FULL_42_14]|nr:MAG: hypothetical protein A3B71_04655 [Gammaproteobacteria bacterium RIFCSPHIGHO2_02_FULL_42_43]OGT27638.1 MAG: hypothetical protein A2624_02540 [Gammaproteobacteria bacterium RIFCSPHIGHO2_01_FULL_42_8]OGT53153.1 MAG: hypothetical protein A3E54_08515 [Gammaproteobacteria bacterium RIFCSPHIGHO2_12_FULL_41_25]OGT60982.1 MAG: hypothetical protein A3I77_00865 [Gammaproteobacteria bacterium RIFCSPLOWO2_02_FULL_42_14]OGT85298.1 MAG: hypothetical protein A3G86_05500 [Gammaproteobacteria bacterium R